MARRILTALVTLPLLVGAIWAGYPWTTVIVAAAALLGVREFYRLASGPTPPLILPLGALWTVLIVVSGQLTDEWYEYAPQLLAGATITAALPALIVARHRPRALTMWAYAVGGPLYVGFLLAHTLMLRELDGDGELGRNWLLFALLVTFATDTGAFITGRTFGRRPMSPSISPNKTWEGSIGGFMVGVGIALALGPLLQLSVPVWQRALVGASIGVLAQLGDLAESRLKRVSGAKDAGSLLPGHGGILDRIDSIVFTVPIVYYLVEFVLKPSR